MKNFILSAALSFTLWLPMIDARPVRMAGALARQLIDTGQASNVKKYEDGSASFTWQDTRWSACITPDYGCTE